MTTLRLRHPTFRTLSAMPLSAAVTLALILLMYSLIKANYEFIEEPAEPPRIMNVVMKAPGPIETIYEKPVRPQPIESEPKIPTPEFDPTPVGPEVIRVAIAPPTPAVTDIFAGGDQLMAFIKVQPNYPARAAERGIEGYVDVMFDVSAMGTTENIRILHAEPSTVFNNNVIQAVKRWKYKPKVIDGVAMASYNLRERITFKLD